MTFSDCGPSMGEIIAKTNGWSTRHLSYVGRLQLIEAVILVFKLPGANSFLCQILFLKESPKFVLDSFGKERIAMLMEQGSAGS